MLSLALAADGDLDAQRTYRDQHLSRGANPLTMGLLVGGLGTVKTVPSWTIYDGGGTSYGAIAFAEKVGDKAVYDYALKRKKTNLGVGIGLVAVSPILGALGNRSINWAADHPGAPEYEQVVEQAYALYTLSSVSLTAGVITLYVGHRSRMKMEPYYTPEQADQLIRKHNAKLAAGLGITDETAYTIEIGPNGVGLSGSF